MNLRVGQTQRWLRRHHDHHLLGDMRMLLPTKKKPFHYYPYFFPNPLHCLHRQWHGCSFCSDITSWLPSFRFYTCGFSRNLQHISNTKACLQQYGHDTPCIQECASIKFNQQWHRPHLRPSSRASSAALASLLSLQSNIPSKFSASLALDEALGMTGQPLCVHHLSRTWQQGT